MRKFILVFLIFLVGCSGEYLVIDSNVRVEVEMADSLEEKQRGLMFRESLGDNEGMLFVFDEEDYHSFWMKNTLISLEMIHINADKEIVDIIHAIPCDKELCESYRPKAKSKYVLEVNEGFSSQNNVRVGSTVKF